MFPASSELRHLTLNDISLRLPILVRHELDWASFQPSDFDKMPIFEITGINPSSKYSVLSNLNGQELFSTDILDTGTKPERIISGFN